MSRATLISRVIFGLLVLATFTAFFVAQRLKRTEPLVYAVHMKRYVSPNNDDIRERGYLSFRTKHADRVTVEVLDRARRVVRTLAEGRELPAGAHRFYWRGRERAHERRTGRPVADGAYRVRILLARAGRVFMPDKFFVVDTTPPRLGIAVVGSHTVSALSGRPRAVRVKFAGVSSARRVEFDVYEVRGQRASSRPVASFLSTRRESYADWNLKVGRFDRRTEPCFGPLKSTGRARPAPAGAYVFVAHACDAAGNSGASSASRPPRPGDVGAGAGLTLRGVELAPGMLPLTAGRVTELPVNSPTGGFKYRLRRVGGTTVKRGTGRGATLRMRVPDVRSGLYTLTVTVRHRQAGGGGTAVAPVAVSGARPRGPLLVYPSIAWQGLNQVDVDGDGFSDDFASDSNGREMRVRAARTLAGGRLPGGFNVREAALARYLADRSKPLAARVTTDYALALDPSPLLTGRSAVLFAGDERWITPQLGSALRQFVKRGGRVAFFAPDAFRRTVRLAAGTISGPSQRAERDVFGESITVEQSAAAPLVAFADQLGLLRGPTGLFTRFENSRSRARTAEVQTAAGRRAGSPALVAYRLGEGLVIRVGADRWQSRLMGSTVDSDVAFTTERILAELLR